MSFLHLPIDMWYYAVTRPRDDSGYGLGQWVKMLQSNASPHWLSLWLGWIFYLNVWFRSVYILCIWLIIYTYWFHMGILDCSIDIEIQIQLQCALSLWLQVTMLWIWSKKEILGDFKVEHKFERKIFMFFWVLLEIPGDLTGIKLSLGFDDMIC